MEAIASRTATRLMEVHRSIASMRSARKLIEPNSSVGFVPTMGALHDGHLSLIKEARAKNDIVVASIFVNPTQFGQNEDLDKYPRQFTKDSELLADLGVDHLFAPETPAMYNPNHITYVQPEGFDDLPEGLSRPGHFRGVATIVTKLFNLVQPTRAYFGQKDAAQCCLIERIVGDLNLDVEVRVMDTIREPDGLAMSSRNAYLTPAERQAAPTVYRALCAGERVFREKQEEGGMIAAEEIREAVMGELQREPLISDVQYVSVDSRVTMKPVEEVGDDGAVVSLACKVGSVRLIDNIVLK